MGNDILFGLKEQFQTAFPKAWASYHGQTWRIDWGVTHGHEKIFIFQFFFGSSRRKLLLSAAVALTPLSTTLISLLQEKGVDPRFEFLAGRVPS